MRPWQRLLRDPSGGSIGWECNARFPLRPSERAFALNTGGSILNTTGPALRDLAGWEPQVRGGRPAARLRPGTEWFVELNRYAVGVGALPDLLIQEME